VKHQADRLLGGIEKILADELNEFITIHKNGKIVRKDINIRTT